MKLIYAIVRNDNEDDVMDALNKDHFQVTKLASTGGFLRKGNSTLMIATQDDMVDECIELIKKQCGKRQKITVNMPYVSGTSMGTYTTMPMPVEIGGDHGGRPGPFREVLKRSRSRRQGAAVGRIRYELVRMSVILCTKSAPHALQSAFYRV